MRSNNNIVCSSVVCICILISIINGHNSPNIFRNFSYVHIFVVSWLVLHIWFNKVWYLCLLILWRTPKFICFVHLNNHNKGSVKKFSLHFLQVKFPLEQAWKMLKSSTEIVPTRYASEPKTSWYSFMVLFQKSAMKLSPCVYLIILKYRWPVFIK